MAKALTKKREKTFREIIKLNDHDIQKVMREIDSQEMAKALKSADFEVRNKIFKNMTKRASVMLKEDIEYMGHVRLFDVEESQKKILSIIHFLAYIWEIVLPENFTFPDEFPSIIFFPSVSFNNIEEFERFLLTRNQPEKF